MISVLILLAQAATELPPAPPPPMPVEAAAKPAATRPAAQPDSDIVVTSRRGEHPARLGKPLPEVAGPMLPKAEIDLGNGVTLASEGRTHDREGGEEIHFTLKVPF